MTTEHVSAVAFEASTEAALAARRRPAVVCSQVWRCRRCATTPSTSLAARRPPGPGHGGRGRRRWLARPPPDSGVLNHAVEDDPGGVVVLLLGGLGWRLRQRAAPCLDPRHALAAG